MRRASGSHAFSVLKPITDTRCVRDIRIRRQLFACFVYFVVNLFFLGGAGIPAIDRAVSSVVESSFLCGLSDLCAIKENN